MALGHKALYVEEEANTIQEVIQRGKCQHKPKHHNRQLQGYIQETQDGSWTQSLICWGRSQHNPGSDTEGKVPTQTETSQQATARVHSANTGNRMALGHKAFYAEEEANTIQLVMQKGKCQHKPKHHNRLTGKGTLRKHRVALHRHPKLPTHWDSIPPKKMSLIKHLRSCSQSHTLVTTTYTQTLTTYTHKHLPHPHTYTPTQILTAHPQWWLPYCRDKDIYILYIKYLNKSVWHVSDWIP